MTKVKFAGGNGKADMTVTIKKKEVKRNRACFNEINKFTYRSIYCLFLNCRRSPLDTLDLCNPIPLEFHTTLKIKMYILQTIL
jgi:hypothetical protein